MTQLLAPVSEVFTPDRITLMHACPYCKERGEIRQYDIDDSVEHHCQQCDICWLQWPDGERVALETATEMMDFFGD